MKGANKGAAEAFSTALMQPDQKHYSDHLPNTQMKLAKDLYNRLWNLEMQESPTAVMRVIQAIEHDSTSEVIPVVSLSCFEATSSPNPPFFKSPPGPCYAQGIGS